MAVGGWLRLSERHEHLHTHAHVHEPLTHATRTTRICIIAIGTETDWNVCLTTLHAIRNMTTS
jgi:hypothetical protein